MKKSHTFAALAAAGLLAFAAHAAADIFKPIPQPCPSGKVEKLLYDKSGRPVGRVCV
ncbi:hypothetical protein [Lysobacter enzymogenes]|uniref:hypothetical protein n=1 Tax=Lysobacter enzymogenes TaxID=69 RepID=UPI001A97C6C2|nr:hypothetical protein [Lysobacter enzymogenes]QQP97920.1 hypothetical protein JHW38_07935 [Lysobacter enzymogenes]